MTTHTTVTCDRCGVEKPDEQPWGYVQLLEPMPSRHAVYGDLCPPCTKAVKAFLRPPMTR